MNKSYYESADYEPEKGIAQVLGALGWTKTCTGVFLKENGEAITAFFTLIIGLFTGALWTSTNRLWRSSEQQITTSRQIAAIQAHQTRVSNREAARAAEAAIEGNKITREVFTAQQRPWLLWRLPPIAMITNDGRHLTLPVLGELENIGKAPAFNVAYFGKFFLHDSGTGMVNQGTAFFSEHLQEAVSQRLSLTTILPTDKAPMRFQPPGIVVASLPTNRSFSLCFAFHAKYEHAGKIAEIGAVYMLQPLPAGKTIQFQSGEFRGPKSVALVELPGSKRIT